MVKCCQDWTQSFTVLVSNKKPTKVIQFSWWYHSFSLNQFFFHHKVNTQILFILTPLLTKHVWDGPPRQTSGVIFHKCTSHVHLARSRYVTLNNYVTQEPSWSLVHTSGVCVMLTNHLGHGCLFASCLVPLCPFEEEHLWTSTDLCPTHVSVSSSHTCHHVWFGCTETGSTSQIFKANEAYKCVICPDLLVLHHYIHVQNVCAVTNYDNFAVLPVLILQHWKQ